MASIKETFSTTATKVISADIKFEDDKILYRTEEMTEFKPLIPIVKYFDGKFIKLTFKEEIKSEELPTDEEENEEDTEE